MAEGDVGVQERRCRDVEVGKRSSEDAVFGVVVI